MNNVRENPNDEKQMEESHKITRKDKKQPEEQQKKRNKQPRNWRQH